MASLFERVNFRSHSGKPLHWKINCDALTDEDIETLAFVVSRNFIFNKVIGVPAGGLRLAKALEWYCDPGVEQTLIVDDVLTTGRSMEEIFKGVKGPKMGLVIFARGPAPTWVNVLFQCGIGGLD